MPRIAEASPRARGPVIAIITALAVVVAACGGGGGGGADGGFAVAGTAANGALVGVPMRLTCRDGSTHSTIAGTDADPGRYRFSLPATCAAPYLIEAAGPGRMRPLDGSEAVAFDPGVNAPLKTIAYGRDNIHLTPLTTLVAQWALDARAGDHVRVSADDLAAQQARLAASLAPIGPGGAPPVEAADVAALVNANPAEKPQVARLGDLLAAAIAAGRAEGQSSLEVVRALGGLSPSLNLSDASNLPVAGLNVVAAQAKADALGRRIEAVVAAWTASGKPLSGLTPAEAFMAMDAQIDSARANPTDPASRLAILEFATTRSLSQIDAVRNAAAAAIEAEVDSPARKSARLRAVFLASDLLQARVRQQIAAGLTGSAGVDVADEVARAKAAARGLTAAVRGAPEGDFVRAEADAYRHDSAALAGAAGTALVLGRAASASMDRAALDGLVADATSSAGLAGRQFAAGFVAPPPVAGNRPDLDRAVASAAALATVGKLDAGQAGVPAALANAAATATAIAAALQQAVVASAGSLPATLPAERVVFALVGAVTLPDAVDFASGPATATVSPTIAVPGATCDPFAPPPPVGSPAPSC